jgi:hypothetical protein
MVPGSRGGGEGGCRARGGGEGGCRARGGGDGDGDGDRRLRRLRASVGVGDVSAVVDGVAGSAVDCVAGSAVAVGEVSTSGVRSAFVGGTTAEPSRGRDGTREDWGVSLAATAAARSGVCSSPAFSFRSKFPFALFAKEKKGAERDGGGGGGRPDDRGERSERRSGGAPGGADDIEWSDFFFLCKQASDLQWFPPPEARSRA